LLAGDCRASWRKAASSETSLVLTLGAPPWGPPPSLPGPFSFQRFLYWYFFFRASSDFPLFPASVYCHVVRRSALRSCPPSPQNSLSTEDKFPFVVYLPLFPITFLAWIFPCVVVISFDPDRDRVVSFLLTILPPSFFDIPCMA